MMESGNNFRKLRGVNVNNYGMGNLKQFKYKKIVKVKQDSIKNPDEMTYRPHGVRKSADRVSFLQRDTITQTNNTLDSRIMGVQENFNGEGEDIFGQSRFFVDRTYYRDPPQDISSQASLQDRLKEGEYTMSVNRLLTKQQKEQHRKLYGDFIDPEIERKHQPVRVYTEFDIQKFTQGIGENVEKLL